MWRGVCLARDHPVQLGQGLAKDAAALILLAAGLSWTVIREGQRHAAVARLAHDLGAAPPPGSLQAALARSLGDPSIRVSYWLPSTEQWVDSSGRPMADPAGSR